MNDTAYDTNRHDSLPGLIYHRDCGQSIVRSEKCRNLNVDIYLTNTRVPVGEMDTDVE